MSPLKPAAIVPAAYLGLGSNQGDRAALLAEALLRLHRTAGAEVVAVSSLYATAPVGLTDQPEFLNAVAAIHTTLPPRELLAACLRIESELGRVRTVRWGPRPIDLDLLLYGDLRLTDAVLTLPHPRMAERAFVLAPLAELAPDTRLDGQTIAARAAAIDRAGERRVDAPKFGWPPLLAP
jgi:2-amino-4-hydroxy-6-hydroxymethyldihydropteridine diphosphokinase